MAQEASPAFQFYVKEWRSSRAIMRMTFAQRGMYLEMLLEQWENHSLPDDPATVAELLGGTVEEWTAAWPVLRRKFVDRRSRRRTEGADNTKRRIVNLTLERVRRERNNFKRVCRQGGLARAKSGSRSKHGTYLPADKPAANQPLTSSPSPSPSPSASASASANTKRVPCPRKDHVFCGRHFHVSYAQQARLEEGISEQDLARLDLPQAYARWDRESPTFDNLLVFLRGKIRAELAGSLGGDLYDKLPHVYQCPTCRQIHEGTRAQMEQRVCLKASA